LQVLRFRLYCSFWTRDKEKNTERKRERKKGKGQDEKKKNLAENVFEAALGEVQRQSFLLPWVGIMATEAGSILLRLQDGLAWLLPSNRLFEFIIHG
jgi:hypothetical protein